MKEFSSGTINVYGVQMTSLEQMSFSKWLSNEGIAMNTKTEKERKKVASKWLKEIRELKSYPTN